MGWIAYVAVLGGTLYAAWWGSRRYLPTSRLRSINASAAGVPWRSRRPAPRRHEGTPPTLDDVNWTRVLDKRETYRVVYEDRNGEASERVIELLKVGNRSGLTYLGVMHEGKFKTMRADRLRQVEQLSAGHEPSIRKLPTYDDKLPDFPVAPAIYKVPTIKGNRTWTVDLNTWYCACPEKRIRAGMGYQAGQLGWVCPHLARAVLDHLPADLDPAAGWNKDLLEFLSDPTKMSIDNLT